jgi:hypothetical protein
MRATDFIIESVIKLRGTTSSAKAKNWIEKVYAKYPGTWENNHVMVWGTPTKYLNIKPEFRDESERASATDMLANDMGYMFDDVLSSSVGKIFVM